MKSKTKQAILTFVTFLAGFFMTFVLTKILVGDLGFIYMIIPFMCFSYIFWIFYTLFKENRKIKREIKELENKLVHEIFSDKLN